MSESIPSRTTSAPLMMPTSSADRERGRDRRSRSTSRGRRSGSRASSPASAMVGGDREVVVAGGQRQRAARASSTTSTAWEPKMVEKFAVVRNVSGRRIPKTTTTPPQTTEQGVALERRRRAQRVASARPPQASPAPAALGRRAHATTPATSAAMRRVALLDDPLLRHVVADELAPDAAAAEDEHPVADERELLVVAARAEHVHARARRRPRGSSPKICCRAPTSTPCVGSSRSRSRGSVWNHFASSAFCWLPPDSAPYGSDGSFGRTSNSCISAAGLPAHPAPLERDAVEVAVEHRRAPGSRRPAASRRCRRSSGRRGSARCPAVVAAVRRQPRQVRSPCRRARAGPARAERAP